MNTWALKKPAVNMQIQLKANKESNFSILNFTKWRFVCGGVEMIEKKINKTRMILIYVIT